MRFKFPTAAVAVIILSGSGAAWGLDIDRFTTPQSTPPNSEIVAPEALGGARGMTDVIVITTSIADGLLVITNDSTDTAGAGELSYDGSADGFFSNPADLGPLDLTASGTDRFAFQIEDIEGTAVIQVLIRGNMEDCWILEAVSSTGTFELLFDQTGINRSDCTAAAASVDSLLMSIRLEAGNSIALSSIVTVPSEFVFADGFEAE